MHIFVIMADGRTLGYAATYAIAEASVRLTHSQQPAAVFTTYPSGMTVSRPDKNEVYSFIPAEVMQAPDHL